MKVDALAWLLVAGMGAVGFFLYPRFSLRARDIRVLGAIAVAAAMVGTLIRSTALPYSVMEILLVPEMVWGSEHYFGARLQVTGYMFIGGTLGLLLSAAVRKGRGRGGAL